jgi:Flp pilus assembly protein TadG
MKKIFNCFYNQNGTVLLELALILPVLLLFISGIVQFGFVLNAKVAANSAAYEAARTATISEEPYSSAAAAIENYANGSLPGWKIGERLKAVINIPDTNPGTLITVEVIYSVPVFFSGIIRFPDTVNGFTDIKGMSAMRIEEKE